MVEENKNNSSESVKKEKDKTDVTKKEIEKDEIKKDKKEVKVKTKSKENKGKEDEVKKDEAKEDKGKDSKAKEDKGKDSKAKEDKGKDSKAKEDEVKTEEVKPKKKRDKIAIINVYSSKNDTIITATDLTGAETLSWASGGMVVKSHREEGRPYAAMQATIKVMNIIKDKGVGKVHIRIRGSGGNKARTPASGAQAVVRTVARSGVRVLKIEDVTPLPTDSMKRKGGRRGRRM